MPGIGSLIREIAVEISEMWESKHTFAQYKTKPCVLRVKIGLEWQLQKLPFGFCIANMVLSLWLLHWGLWCNTDD